MNFTLDFRQYGAISFVVGGRLFPLVSPVAEIGDHPRQSSEVRILTLCRGLGTATSLSLVSGQMVVLRPGSASPKQIRAEAEAGDADGTLIVGK